MNQASIQQPLLFNAYSWTDGEKHVFKKRVPLSVSEWAQANRVLGVESAYPGPWRNSKVPYLVDIMDTWGRPYVRKVIVCAAAQVGKTESMYNCLGYAIDRNPGPALVVMPDQEMCRRVSKDRIQPMIKLAVSLKRLLSADPDDLAKMRIKFRSGMAIYLSWASSPSLMSAMPIQYLFLDESDKYPPLDTKKEGDPVSLAEARTTTYQYTKKIFMVSTPTVENKFIWKALTEEAQEVRDYHVPCPYCGQFQVMKFEQIRFPEGVEPKRIRRKYLARYECEHCEDSWSDNDRNQAVKAGHWIAREEIERPQSVGFHLPVYYSPFVSLSEIAATYLEAEEWAKTGDKAKLIHFYNSLKAEPYNDIQKERQEDVILSLRDERPRGLVPADISCLTAAVDTQQRGFYFEIRAWGYGMSLESWLVYEGYVESFSGLAQILFDNEYKDAQGKAYKVQFALIDSGGTYGDYGVSRTAQVYDFCRKYRGIFPLKGQQKMSQLYRVRQLDNYPGTNKPIPGGLKLYNINVTYFKDTLHHKLQIAPADPGAWHLHSEATEDYARQMCVEYKDNKGHWQCPRGKANHYWDLGVYSLAISEILRIRFTKSKQQTTDNKNLTPKKREPKPKRKRW